MQLVSRTQIEQLQAAGAHLPQFVPKTEHYFSNGMYVRKAHMPATLIVVGKVHKHPHFFVLCAGEMIVVDEKGRRTLHSGDVICSEAGTKRALICVTDCIGMNVHRTDKTDLDEIEAELIEPDDSALFDAHNMLKDKALTCT